MLLCVVDLFILCLLLRRFFRERVLPLELVLLLSFALMLVVMWVENATPLAFWLPLVFGEVRLGGVLCS